ncbi:MAG: hypothetical protein WAV13_04630 [Thermodesulfovibrionales bacterium]
MAKLSIPALELELDSEKRYIIFFDPNVFDIKSITDLCQDIGIGDETVDLDVMFIPVCIPIGETIKDLAGHILVSETGEKSK